MFPSNGFTPDFVRSCPLTNWSRKTADLRSVNGKLLLKTADLGRFKMANYFLKIASISRNQFISVSIGFQNYFPEKNLD